MRQRDLAAPEQRSSSASAGASPARPQRRTNQPGARGTGLAIFAARPVTRTHRRRANPARPPQPSPQPTEPGTRHRRPIARLARHPARPVARRAGRPDCRASAPHRLPAPSPPTLSRANASTATRPNTMRASTTWTAKGRPSDVERATPWLAVMERALTYSTVLIGEPQISQSSSGREPASSWASHIPSAETTAAARRPPRGNRPGATNSNGATGSLLS